MPIVLLAPLLLAAALPGPALTVDIGNVRNARGRVRIDICPKDRFLADGCPWHVSVPARPGTTVLSLPALPPGDYAIQAFHDENANDNVDRGLFGIPLEGVGFSRDAKIVFSPPKWADAMFHHDGTPQRLGFHLRYWTGPSGPAEWKARHPRG